MLGRHTSWRPRARKARRRRPHRTLPPPQQQPRAANSSKKWYVFEAHHGQRPSFLWDASAHYRLVDVLNPRFFFGGPKAPARELAMPVAVAAVAAAVVLAAVVVEALVYCSFSAPRPINRLARRRAVAAFWSGSRSLRFGGVHFDFALSEGLHWIALRGGVSLAVLMGPSVLLLGLGGNSVFRFGCLERAGRSLFAPAPATCCACPAVGRPADRLPRLIIVAQHAVSGGHQHRAAPSPPRASHEHAGHLLASAAIELQARARPTSLVIVEGHGPLCFGSPCFGRVGAPCRSAGAIRSRETRDSERSSTRGTRPACFGNDCLGQCRQAQR